MRRFMTIALSTVVLGSTALVGVAHAMTGKSTADTVNYAYTGVTGPDSSTCGGNWANDKETRTFKIYKEQADNGSYQVLETFAGSFKTLAGPSPESCEAGNSHTLTANISGMFHGQETLIVHNADVTGDWNPATNVNCSATCTTTEFIQNAFGASATFDTATDWWFSYKTTNTHACAQHWINANYGNSGDIATTCTVPTT